MKIDKHIERGDISRVSEEMEFFFGGRAFDNKAIISQFDLFSVMSEESGSNLPERLEIVTKSISSQIVYLPTYRRIEQELDQIFVGVDPDDFKKGKRRIISQKEDGTAYFELVEFGMRDVQEAVNKTLDQLKEFERKSLNELTLRYLGDVVNRSYENTAMAQISDISEGTIHSVLERIHENILNKTEKRHLFEVISSAKTSSNPKEHEKIIYHYFAKLLSFQEELQKKETQMASFCSLCNEYMSNKQFVYDSASFTLKVVINSESGNDSVIELADLSSGEKQIVSLFSHLYLSQRGSFFVIIDEPELSLSVPWQRRFLADIWKGEYCSGLVAATHSPFIYENDLKPFTYSLGEFISV